MALTKRTSNSVASDRETHSHLADPCSAPSRALSTRKRPGDHMWRRAESAGTVGWRASFIAL